MCFNKNRTIVVPFGRFLLLVMLAVFRISIGLNNAAAQSSEKSAIADDDRGTQNERVRHAIDGLEFPYQAIVMADNAAVRSGPGAVHYSTSLLKPGSTVEVYRHDPGGWCAIRPPKSSFSLIPAAAVEVMDDGVGEIIDDGTQAWVGTQLGPVEQAMWQIPLKSGEKVELLGEANWPDPSGNSTVWYQIAPPAGEFRWIHLSDLQLPPALKELNRTDVTTTPSPLQNRLDRIEVDETDSFVVEQASYQGSAVGRASENGLPQPRLRDVDSGGNIESINQGWRQASRTGRDIPLGQRLDGIKSGDVRMDQGLNSGGDPDIASVPREVPQAQTSNERLASSQMDPRFDFQQLTSTPQLAPPFYRDNSTSLDPSVPGLRQPYIDRLDPTLPLGGYTGSQPLTPRLTSLELRLNQEMIKEPNQWRLIDLQTATQGIIDSTTDSVEQLQAQRLLLKLGNCREIRSNYLDAFQINNERESADASSASVEEFSLNTIYDAHGWLNELVREGGTKRSTYVLQDDNGKITHHISPATGMNLSSYLKTKVGIIGQRGYHTDLKLAHVTAERVIELRQR